MLSAVRQHDRFYLLQWHVQFFARASVSSLARGAVPQHGNALSEHRPRALGKQSHTKYIAVDLGIVALNMLRG